MALKWPKFESAELWFLTFRSKLIRLNILVAINPIYKNELKTKAGDELWESPRLSIFN